MLFDSSLPSVRLVSRLRLPQGTCTIIVILNTANISRTQIWDSVNAFLKRLASSILLA
ncbi:hypothetical protein MTBLM1_150020 [Rhodospirillaceae bacterium LM-1]|nr:hypothetical protein MTBLM1_150020 [Rhodospirillaceae bacterium LM-1]